MPSSVQRNTSEKQGKARKGERTVQNEMSFLENLRFPGLRLGVLRPYFGRHSGNPTESWRARFEAFSLVYGPWAA